jgi:hypothetical protein
MIVLNEKTNVKFNVRILNIGMAYGLNDMLTAKKKMIEFYDMRYMHTEFGQFVARYDFDTIKNFEIGHGLSLDNGVDSWYLTATNMKLIVESIN